MLTFTPDAAGGFTRPQDLRASLTQNTDGTFALTFNTGEVWSFDSTGQLTGRSMEGQQVTLDYDSGLLVGATHQPSGRSLRVQLRRGRAAHVAAGQRRTDRRVRLQRGRRHQRPAGVGDLPPAAG